MPRQNTEDSNKRTLYGNVDTRISSGKLVNN